MLDNIGSVASIIGLGITLITLCMMLNIRGKIDRSLGKQRFLQQRNRILIELTEIRAAIRCIEGGDRAGLDELLLKLRELLLQLEHYRIWRPSDRLKLRQYTQFISKAYNGQKQCSCKEHVMRIDEVVAMVKAQAEV